MNKIAIICSGGHAKCVYSAVLAESKYEVIGFIDDNSDKLGSKVVGNVKVVGNRTNLNKLLDEGLVGVIIGAGNPYIKEKIYFSLARDFPNLEFISAIDPTAVIEPEVKIGKGVYIGPLSRVGVDTTLGNFVSVNPHANVGHDCLVSDYVGVLSCAHLSGNVSVGNYTIIGANAAIRQGANIGENVIVGMGANVITHLNNNQVVVGSPARYLRNHEYGEDPFTQIQKTI